MTDYTPPSPEAAAVFLLAQRYEDHAKNAQTFAAASLTANATTVTSDTEAVEIIEATLRESVAAGAAYHAAEADRFMAAIEKIQG